MCVIFGFIFPVCSNAIICHIYIFVEYFVETWQSMNVPQKKKKIRVTLYWMLFESQFYGNVPMVARRVWRWKIQLYRMIMMRRLTMIFDERISFVGDKSTWQSNYFYVTRDLLRMLKIWYDFASENDIDAMLQHRNQTAYQTLDARSLTIPCTNRFVFFSRSLAPIKKKHSTKDDK